MEILTGILVILGAVVVAAFFVFSITVAVAVIFKKGESKNE